MSLYGYMGIWVYRYVCVDISVYRYMVCRFMCGSVYVCVGLRVFGYISIWVSGYLGIWVYGYMGISVWITPIGGVWQWGEWGSSGIYIPTPHLNPPSIYENTY
jgi:hypothetical protein